MSKLTSLHMPRRYTDGWRYGSIYSKVWHFIEVSSKLHTPATVLVVPIEQETERAREHVWMIWRRDKSLQCTRNSTTIPCSSNLQPSHYVNYAALAPI